MITVNVKKLHEDAIIPSKAYEDDAGFDLHALENVILEPGRTINVRTGLAFELPEGYEMQIRPRSGVSLRTSLRVALGTVDSQYRGAVGVIVDNIEAISHNDASSRFIGTLNGQQVREADFYPIGTYAILKGDRIAQAVIQKIPSINLVEVEELSDSSRGENGFGSTGI